MTKHDIVKQIADRCGYSMKDVDRVYTEVFDVIGDYIVNDGEFAISGFGKFKTNVKPAKQLFCSFNGKTMDIPEHRVVKFVPSKALKEKLS